MKPKKVRKIGPISMAEIRVVRESKEPPKKSAREAATKRAADGSISDLVKFMDN